MVSHVRQVFRLVALVVALALSSIAVAQEVLAPLQVGRAYPTAKAPKSEAEHLLPFFDDFSGYEGVPAADLWHSAGGWVDKSFAHFPPTVGALTLDAINSEGQLYSTANSTMPFPADTVASCHIRLDSLRVPVARRLTLADSVALSFYYLPGGGSGSVWLRSGDTPDPGDSLVLEFYEAGRERWNRVWATDGVSVDTLLRRTGHDWQYIYIPIDTAIYLNRHFAFRFRNYCSFDNSVEKGLVGNCDQWHIDYVQLEHARTRGYHYSRDVAFVAPPPSMLRKYQAMPARQFRASEMATNLDITITNRFEDQLSARYVFREEDGYLRAYDGGIDNIPAFLSEGTYQTAEAHAHPMVSSTFPTDGVQRVYHITHIVTEGVGGDNHPENDTLRYEQHIENYFAYDDGSAENGYGVYNRAGNISFACGFTLNEADSLSEVRLCFNPTRGDENAQLLFHLCVWADEGGHPGRLLYRDEASRRPEFNGLNGYVSYFLEHPVAVEGRIYVGLQQPSAGVINLGMDRNNDASEHTFYNVGGSWQQSFLAGALMLRPYFGTSAPLEIRPVERNAPNVRVHPNPATDHITVDGTPDGTRLTLYDLHSRMVGTAKEKRISVTHLPAGVYLLKIESPAMPPVWRKVIVAR